MRVVPSTLLAQPHTGVLRDDQREAFVDRLGWGYVLLIVVVWAGSLVFGFQTALGLLTGLAFASAILGLRWPVVGLFGITLLCTMDALTRVYLLTGGLLRWNTFNYVLLGVAALHLPFLLRLNDPQTRLMQFFVFLLGIQLVFSADKSEGVQHLLGAVSMFGLLVYFARSAADTHAWSWIGFIGGVTAGAGSLAYFLLRSELGKIDPNAWSYFPLTALFCICLATTSVAQRRGRQHALALLAMLNFAWLFLSGSRGGLLTGVCCIIYLIVMMRGLSTRVTVIVAATLVSLVLSTQFADLQENTIHRLTKSLDGTYSAADRTSGRADLVLGGWYIFRDHPLGVGTGGFANAWSRLGMREGLSGFKQGVAFDAHAGWIKTLAENGLPGVVLLVSFVLSFTLSGQRRGGALLCLGLLITATLSLAFWSTEFQGKGLWLLCAGGIVAIRRQQIAAHLQGALKREPVVDIVRSSETYRRASW